MMRGNMSGFVVFLFLALSIFACSDGERKESEPLAKINNFTLCYCEFEGKLARELNFDADLKLTPEVKKAFLEQLIQEELLIQEAKRLNLDKKDKFARAIERYWKSTLIRDLLELKGNEINETILVPQAEIDAYYKKMKEERAAVPPLSEIQDLIVKELKEKEKRKRLKAWMMDLQERADIEIHQACLLKD